VQTQEKSSSGERQWQRCSCRLNLNKACVGLFLSWFGGVGQRVCFVFFRDEEWALTMDIFFFVVFFFRRPSSASIDAHSLLSLFLSFFLFSPSLSLSTDNNNFTKDKVLAKQQRAKQNPKKKKRDRDF